MDINKIVKSLDSASKAARLVNATLKGRLPEHLANKEIARAKARLTRKLWL